MLTTGMCSWNCHVGDMDVFIGAVMLATGMCLWDCHVNHSGVNMRI